VLGDSDVFIQNLEEIKVENSGLEGERKEQYRFRVMLELMHCRRRYRPPAGDFN
jgi:hypothetical protein